jgi:hypothetical protein
MPVPESATVIRTPDGMVADFSCVIGNFARNNEPDRSNSADHHEWNRPDHLPLKAMPQLQIHGRLLS